MIEMTYPGGMTITVYAKDTVTIAMFERMGYARNDSFMDYYKKSMDEMWHNGAREMSRIMAEGWVMEDGKNIPWAVDINNKELIRKLKNLGYVLKKRQG